MEYIKQLGLYVDWEKGKIYRRKNQGVIGTLMSLFGNQGEYEEITDKNVELAVKKYKLLELYALAQKMGKTQFRETLEGKEVLVKIEPERIIFETPEVLMEYRPEKFILKNKQTGEVVEKEPTLQEFYTMYKEIRKLLTAGGVQNYLRLKAREPQFREQFLKQSPYGGAYPYPQTGGGFSWGSALLGLGGGMLLGYLLASAMGESFAHTIEQTPPMSPEEQQQIEEQVSAPVEEVLGEPLGGETPADLGETLPEEIEGDYFTQLPDEPFGGDQIADAGDAGGFDDFGDFGDFGDFDV
jgi:hypothetical protein